MCAGPGGEARLAQVEDGSLHSGSQGSLATNRKLQCQFSACLQERSFLESEQVSLENSTERIVDDNTSANDSAAQAQIEVGERGRH